MYIYYLKLYYLKLYKMIKSEIIKLINENSIISNMMLPTQIYGVLYYLDEILKTKFQR